MSASGFIDGERDRRALCVRDSRGIEASVGGVVLDDEVGDLRAGVGVEEINEGGGGIAVCVGECLCESQSGVISGGQSGESEGLDVIGVLAVGMPDGERLLEGDFAVGGVDGDAEVFGVDRSRAGVIGDKADDDAGVDAYLRKPLDLRELDGILDRILAR